MVQNPRPMPAGGAIRSWDRRNFTTFKYKESLAEHYKFDGARVRRGQTLQRQRT